MFNVKDFIKDEEAAVEEQDPNHVTLTWFETQMAVGVGVSRQLECLKNGQKSFKIKGSGMWDPHINGALGELAFAKATGAYFSGSVNTFKSERDVGNYEVRTAANHNLNLIIRPKDDDEHIFVLVTGTCPEYQVRGWIYGKDAKKDEFKRSPQNGGPSAFFVPPTELNSMDSLPKQ